MGTSMAFSLMVVSVIGVLIAPFECMPWGTGEIMRALDESCNGTDCGGSDEMETPPTSVWPNETSTSNCSVSSPTTPPHSSGAPCVGKRCDFELSLKCGANMECYVKACATIVTSSMSGTSTAVQSTTPGISCEGAANGPLSLGCSSNFVVCIDGEANYMRCPDDLKFDASSEQCLNATFVEICGGTPTKPSNESMTSTLSITESTTLSMETMNASTTEMTLETESNVTVLSTLEPTTRASSTESSPFTMVTTELTTAVMTPTENNTQPSTETTQTQPFTESATTGVTNTSQPSTEATIEQTTVIGSEPPKSSATSSPIVCTKPSASVSTPPGFTCEGLGNGAYALGCSCDFVICESGVAHFEKCPEYLRFDEESGQCLVEGSVRICKEGAQNETTEGSAESPTTEQSTTKPATTEQGNTEQSTTGQSTMKQTEATTSGTTSFRETSATPMSTLIPDRNGKYICHGVPDGKYALGCSSKYVRCRNGQISYRRCLDNRKFDPVSQQCLKKRYVELCVGYPSDYMDDWDN